MRWIHWIFALCLLTASFDIFLVFNLGGTVRISQLLMIPVCVAALAKVAQHGRVDWPRGGIWLLVWCGFQVLFLPVSIDLNFSIRYLLFLFITIICFFAVVELYGKSNFIQPLMMAYIVSYVVIAVFGILQLVTPILHLGSYFVMQWIVHDRLARINGFSYEPSYYATYLITGWIVLVDLRYSKANITAGRRWQWLTMLTGLSLFLSTSKSAWIFMIVEGVARGVPALKRWAGSIGRRFFSGRLVVHIPRARVVLLLVVGIVGLAVGLRSLGQVINLNIFLAGTGLNNTAAHSVNGRLDRFLDTVVVFEEHPFIGRSLGGVSSRISEIHGVINDGKTYLGFPVFMDVLAASGLIGIIPFLLFLGANTIGFVSLIRNRWPDERAKWLRALVRGTVFLWLILSVDQNVLRIYVWFHMSVVAAVGLHLSSIRGRADSGNNAEIQPVPQPG
jgi:hypothetical protein